MRILDELKLPYLFSSDQLSKILEVTTSVRTRINMMGMIGPRLVDPKAKTAYFLGLFRYAEEKAQVEEILKARTQTLNSSIFNKGTDLRGGAGRGSAGRGGRGSGASASGRGAGTRGRGHGGSNASLTSSHSGVTSEDHGMTPGHSGDSYDGRSYLIHGTDEVFADIDKMGHGHDEEDSLAKERRETSIAMLESSDEEGEDHHTMALLTNDRKVSTPTRHSGDHGTTDTEQSSVSSEELDHRPKFNSLDVKSSLLDKELMGSSAFGTPPSKIISSAMNPLMKKTQEPKEPTKNDKRVTSLRLSSSNHNMSWQANKEDPSKCVQAGNVLAKMNSFCSGSVPGGSSSASSSSSSTQSRSATSTPRNSLGSKSLKASDYSQAVTQSARKPEEKVLPGKLPPSALSLSNLSHSNSHGAVSAPNSNHLSRAHGSASPTTHLASPVVGFPAPQCLPTNDLAAKCAAVLKITREAFLSLGAEDSKGTSPDGKGIFSYRELVRRNFAKDYTGLVQLELEKHLDPAEFSKVFEKNSVSIFVSFNKRF